MNLRSMWQGMSQRWHSLWFAPISMSAFEQELWDDVCELDHTDPYWDFRPRVMRCRVLVDDAKDLLMVRTIFGIEVFDAAMKPREEPIDVPVNGLKTRHLNAATVGVEPID